MPLSRASKAKRCNTMIDIIFFCVFLYILNKVSCSSL